MCDFMEKFKLLVSAVNVPDDVAIEALRNTLIVHSKFRDDLYLIISSKWRRIPELFSEFRT